MMTWVLVIQILKLKRWLDGNARGRYHYEHLISINQLASLWSLCRKLFESSGIGVHGTRIYRCW